MIPLRSEVFLIDLYGSSVFSRRRQTWKCLEIFTYLFQFPKLMADVNSERMNVENESKGAVKKKKKYKLRRCATYTINLACVVVERLQKGYVHF